MKSFSSCNRIIIEVKSFWEKEKKGLFKQEESWKGNGREKSDLEEMKIRENRGDRNENIKKNGFFFRASKLVKEIVHKIDIIN